MSLVTISWSGKCPNHATQEDLCRKLEDLAELSHAYFEEPKPAIKYFDQAMEGGILLDGQLSEDGVAIPNVSKVSERKPEEQDSVDLFALQSAALYSIEFRLYDGCKFYPGLDRISFVFLRMSDCPELDGQIVYVEDSDQCKLRTFWILSRIYKVTDE